MCAPRLQRGVILASIMTVASRVDSFCLAGWSFQFFTVYWKLRSDGHEIVNELSFFPNFGVSKSFGAIPAVYSTSRTTIRIHDRLLFCFTPGPRLRSSAERELTGEVNPKGFVIAAAKCIAA